MRSRPLDLFDMLSLVEREECLARILAHRILKQTSRCPACGSTQLSVSERFKRLRCNRCRKRISVKSLTPMAGSQHPLGLWLLASWLVCVADARLSHPQLGVYLGISRQAAMNLYRKLRTLMRAANENITLGGPGRSVGICETHVKFLRRSGSGRIKRRPAIFACDAERMVAASPARHSSASTGWFVDRWVANGSTIFAPDTYRYRAIRRDDMVFCPSSWDHAPTRRAHAFMVRSLARIKQAYVSVYACNIEDYLAERVFLANASSPAKAYAQLSCALGSVSTRPCE